MVLSTELFKSSSYTISMEGAYLRANSRVYDIHRAWVESCHEFVMNCCIRVTRRLLSSRVIRRGRRRNGMPGVSVLPKRLSIQAVREKVYSVLLSNGSVLADELPSMQDSQFQGVPTTNPASPNEATDLARDRDRTSGEEVESSGVP